jgi:hypothetical protein
MATKVVTAKIDDEARTLLTRSSMQFQGDSVVDAKTVSWV